MKSMLVSVVICLLLSLFLGTAWVSAMEKSEAPEACRQCGMNRTTYAQSRMLVVYKDGESAGTCSVNCLVTGIKASDKKIKSVQVADYTTKKLIDAKTATWVIGGTKRPVMSSIAKWAFAKDQDARTFIAENGGNLAKYDEVIKASNKEHLERKEKRH